MKTADEFLRESLARWGKENISDAAWEELKKEDTYPAYIEIMKEYAREACKAQREICAVKAHTLKYTILNAPEPELK